jgi:diguanylate cyclase (GGDEF)-like protein/PAS domain S-box-containing protein
MMISGLVWASSIPLLFQSGDITNQTITIFVLTGLCAGAILSYGIDYFVLLGILLPITLTLFASLVAEGSHDSLSTSVMVALFLTFAIALSRKSNKDYIENITLARAAILGKNREKANTHIMEMIAHNETLDKILEEIVLNLEKQDASMLCSILLLDKEGKHLKLMAAPSLPDFYNKAIDGIAIGPDVGCCGAAAYTGSRVIAEDILKHPNWKNYTELATKANLRACWSEPIKDATDALLGTFAIYHRQPTTPTEKDIQTIMHNAALVGIAVGLARNYQEQRLAALLYQNTTESMMITDSNNTIIAVNPAFTNDTGYRDTEVIGKNPHILKSGRHDSAFYDDFYHALNTTGKWQGEIWNRRKNGEIYPQWINISTIYGDDGEMLNRVCLATDVTNRKQSEELIWRQANFDSLTDLPNRHMFHEQFQQEIKKTQRSNLPLALFFIDLDEFKEVNDTLGHHMGDLLLKETAQRLSHCIRESDTTARLDTIARLGGDEFTIILSELNSIECVERIAQRILEKIAEPYHLKEEVVHISASIGITLYPDDSTDIDTLLKNADQAMYAAKKEGKNRFSYFTSSMQAKVLKRMQLTKDLRSALAKQQFHLVYQPIVNLNTNKVIKAEALIRWQHPTKGLVSPAEFIPIAESTGLINEIGNWVFFEAIEQAKLWRQSINPDFQISINKSPIQFQHIAKNEGENGLNWPQYLQAHDIEGSSIAVEITEGFLLENSEALHHHLLEFRDAGIQVALDDFGTGYSSLSYLKKFDIDYLKIDQSFVQNLEAESDDMALCQAIIVMAHKLNLKVIAEGIETQEQLNLLKASGCDFGQGYFLSKPLTADRFEQFIANKKL